MSGQLRITGGRLVRRRLNVPKTGVRPTSDRAREALFSVLGPLDGCVVADLCAGTGALAFEAISRGASRAIAVEQSRRTAQVLTANAKALGVLDLVHVVVSDCARVVDRGAAKVWDLVFIDPPYDDAIAPALFDALRARLADGARVVVERRAKTDEPVPPGYVETFDRTWGEARVRVFELAADVDEAEASAADPDADALSTPDEG